MRVRQLLMFLAALFLACLHIAGQPTLSEDRVPGDPGALKLGVVVEAVDKNLEGEKAGLQEGDVLLSWVRGEVSGTIETPLSLSRIEIEQRPQGIVRLQGIRNGEPRIWPVGLGSWGITARPNLPGSLLSVYRKGQELAEAGKTAQASERWLTAADAASSQSTQVRAWFLFQVAQLFSRIGQWKESDDAYQQAISQASALRSEDVALLFLQWAITFDHRGDRNKAEKYYLQAITESQKWGDENLAALSLTDVGISATDGMNLAKAEGYLREALKIREKLEPDSLQVGHSLLNMSMLSIEPGDLVSGEEWGRRGLLIHKKLAPHGDQVLAGLNNLGVISRQRGEFDLAEEYYLEALKMKEESAPDSPIVATFLQNLGVVAYMRGDLKQAEEYLQRALSILQKIGPGTPDEALPARGAGVASTLADLGDVAQRHGDLVKAEEFFAQALAIEQKLAPESITVADIFRSQGDVSRKSGDLAKAEAHYRHALAIRERLTPGSWEHAETLAGLAWIMRQTLQEDVAVDLYGRALNALESQMAHLGGAEETRSGFRATHERYYKEYIDLLMARKQPELAFQIVERSRARTLLELLATSHLDVRKGVDPTLLDRERSFEGLLQARMNKRVRLLSSQHTKEQLEAIDREITTLLREHEDVEARIRAGSPGYAALTQPQPLDAQAVQRLLPEDTLLLEYSLGESHSYVFALTAHSLNSYKLPTSAEIEGKAARLYQLLTERSRILPAETDRQRRTRLGKADSEFKSAAIELSRILLGPVGAELRQRRLLIVSDGALQYIPFAALPTPGLSPDKPSYSLIVQHEIINLPSASVLAFLRHNSAANKEVVVFADPVFDKQDSRVKSDSARLDPDTLKQNLSQESRSLTLPPPQLTRNLIRSVADVNPGLKGELHLPRLAFTRDEAKAILAVVRPGSSMEAIDFDASRKRAISGELARYRVVHFATHALVDNIHPELSGLVLSLVDQRGKPVDGFLGLQDIYNLDLSADLVVLSACQTALGKQINGEGMIGLTRGFMYAGASGVMATLWNVNDFATAKLMAHFYKAMEQDGMTPAQALRQAQLALWKSQPTSAPYNWAGFILQGGWQ